MNDDLDMISFRMIANAGDARAFAFEALDAAKKGEDERADELMKKAHHSIELARREQTDLLFADMNGDKKKVGILLVHSQDHLMDALLAIDLIEQMIGMEKSIVRLQKRIEKLERDQK